jgi:hypothetical protein
LCSDEIDDDKGNVMLYGGFPENPAERTITDNRLWAHSDAASILVMAAY